MSYVQQAHTFTKQLTITVTRHYLFSLPKDYDPRQPERWPLVLFLHGLGERGDDLYALTRHGPPKLVEEGQDFPFLFLSPQCPTYGWWTWETNIAALAALLDEIESAYLIDPDQVYVTGLSMGGYGTWALATAYPHRFAAIAPICGGGDPSTVCAIRHLPVWAFHGENDSVVPLQETEAMVKALQACGGHVTLTVYPGVDHDSWTQTYANPQLYTWLLQHRRITGPNEKS